MTVELPNLSETSQLSDDELRMELACARFSRGGVGKAAVTELGS